MAFTILGPLQQHVDCVAALDRHVAVLVEELVNRDETFGLVTDVDNDGGLSHFQHSALDDLPLRHVAETVVVGLEHGRKLLGVHVFVVHWFESGACRFAGACSPRRHGLTASRFGRYQPGVYIRHYVRVLLNRRMP